MFGNEENVLHNVIVIYLTFISQLSHAILSLKSRFIELITSGKLNCVRSYIQFQCFEWNHRPIYNECTKVFVLLWDQNVKFMSTGSTLSEPRSELSDVICFGLPYPLLNGLLFLRCTVVFFYFQDKLAQIITAAYNMCVLENSWSNIWRITGATSSLTILERPIMVN